MFHVYILRSLRNGKRYVGHTDDLDRRFAEHNSARGGKFSRLNAPWELVHQEPHPDRSSAMRRERYIEEHRRLPREETLGRH